ncbi:MAG: homoserine kinase [Bacillota bacterium]
MITVRVPATTANLGPGFDVLGLALSLYNFVEMELREQGLEIEISGEGKDIISQDTENIVYKAAQSVWKKCGFQCKGLYIKLVNNIPLARGLGSSAAAIIGGMLAANALAGNPLSNEELLILATQLEGHPDNVAPALFGGLVISNYENGKMLTHRIVVNNSVHIIATVPDFQLPTKLARELLPEFVSIEDAAFNLSRISFLVTAFITGNYQLLRIGMEDKLHQPYRSKLIPGLEAAFKNAKNAGALGVTLSGSGPTVVAFSTKSQELENISLSMANAFQDFGINVSTQKLLPDNFGAKVVNGGF